MDGTSCSYDHPEDICVQGKCVQLGCDKILGSPVSEDDCGVCGGDGTKCRVKTKTFKGRGGGKKLIILQRGARNIRIVVKKMAKASKILLCIDQRPKDKISIQNILNP